MANWDSLSNDDKKFGVCMALTREKCGGDANAWDNYPTCKTEAFPKCMNDSEDNVYGVPRQQKYIELVRDDFALATKYATDPASYEKDKNDVGKVRFEAENPLHAQPFSMCLAVSREGCGDWNATVESKGYNGSECKVKFAKCFKDGTYDGKPVKEVYTNAFKGDYTLANDYAFTKKQVEPEYKEWIYNPNGDFDIRGGNFCKILGMSETPFCKGVTTATQNSTTRIEIPGITSIPGMPSNSNRSANTTFIESQPLASNSGQQQDLCKMPGMSGSSFCQSQHNIPGMSFNHLKNEASPASLQDQSVMPSRSFVQGKVESCALNMISRASNPSTCIADLIAVKGVSSTDNRTINDYKEICSKAGNLPVKFFHDVCQARTDAENNVWTTKQDIIR